jgi:hypothetical protein
LRMPINNSRWPFFALGIAFLVTGALHLVAWFFIVFAYHANAIPDVARYCLPVYGLLGGSGVWIFLLIILIDFAAGSMLMASRSRGRVWTLVAAVLNLPIIPLGTVVGAVAILIMVFRRQDRT